MIKTKRYCKCGCGKIVIGHSNKKFFSTKHKDQYHNRTNPRGFYAPIKQNGVENIGHKIDSVEDDMHPCDPYCFGQ